MQRDASLSARSTETQAVVNGFNDAFNRKDVDGIMAAMTEDCVFESTSPAPNGTRFQGQAAVRALWEDFFKSSPGSSFETEDMFVAEDKCTIRWRYRRVESGGKKGEIRGVDIFTVRDGNVAEKMAYVKG
jgi:ketosteroid isomerase-like protein